MKIYINQIKPSEINSEIYSPTDLTDIEQSLQTNGQLEPIVVNKNNEIISGHRRYYSMIHLGWNECEVRKTDYENDIIALIEHNRHRTKTVEDILNEARILETELKKQLGGQGSRSDLKGNGRFSTVREISDKLGIGTSKLKQLNSIYNYEPELISSIDKGELSVNKAYEIVREKYFNTKKKVKDGFEVEFKHILKKYQPERTKIDDVIKKVYPYSISTSDEINPKLMEKRDELIENLEFLKSLDSKELVIYRKLKEIKRNGFDKKLSKEIKSRIWFPSDVKNKQQTISEIEQLQPYVELSKDKKEFDLLRVLIHSFEWVRNVGRLLPFIVKDKRTEKYLGLITVASDLTKIECRDDWLGWDNNHKYKFGKLRNTAIISTIVPVQPFGYNFLGGKLIACLSTTPIIRNIWKEKYGDELVGLTTTSLYGSYSMYNGIPLWKKMGESKGKIILKPDEEIYHFWLRWLKENHHQKYDSIMSVKENGSVVSGPKQKLLNCIYNYLGIKINDYFVEQNRGVYFAPLYSNTKEFLTNKIKEDELKPMAKEGMDFILNWWKSKAIKRYEKLYDEGRVQTEPLWYEDMDENIVNSWFNSRGVRISN